MDLFERSLHLLREVGRAVGKDLANLDFDSFKQRIVNFDIRDVDAPAASLTMLLTVFTGLFALVAYAQLTDKEFPPGKSTDSSPLATGSSVLSKPGAPPIPPPSEIVSLRVYPIKSCRGFEVDGTRLRKTGLTLDRNWMFVGASDRKFLTIRSDPSMTLIDTSIVDKKGEQHLQISIHGTDRRVIIPAFPTKRWLESNTKLSTVEIWEKETDAWEYGPEINSVFRDFFKNDVVLVYKGPSPRNVATNGAPDMYGREQNHHFADVMSLQVASEASIKDLNRRLQLSGPDSLTIERFRPNIIIRGRDEKPWEEDSWKRVRISTSIPAEGALYKIDLDVVARCARCQVPNVNPDTADKDPKQPWEELMKFRRVDRGGVAKYKPCFGMLCIPRNEGVVKIGAKFEVLETTDKHLYNTAKFEDL